MSAAIVKVWLASLSMSCVMTNELNESDDDDDVNIDDEEDDDEDGENDDEDDDEVEGEVGLKYLANDDIDVRFGGISCLLLYSLLMDVMYVRQEESEGEDFNPDGVDDEEEEELDDEEEDEESTARGQKRKLPDDGDPGTE